jgi:hypothetical protein
LKVLIALAAKLLEVLIDLLGQGFDFFIGICSCPKNSEQSGEEKVKNIKMEYLIYKPLHAV